MNYLSRVCTSAATALIRCGAGVQPHSRFLCSSSSTTNNVVTPATSSTDEDDLFERIVVEVRGHDMAVLRSYSTFVRAAADRLQLPVFTPPDVPHHRRHERRPYTYLHTSLKSAHVHKKHKVQYETRTHWYTYTFTHLTGSTADTLLEYLQRQLPEGVGMIVKKTQCLRVPAHLQSSDST